MTEIVIGGLQSDPLTESSAIDVSKVQSGISHSLMSLWHDASTIPVIPEDRTNLCNALLADLATTLSTTLVYSSNDEFDWMLRAIDALNCSPVERT